MHVNEIHRIRQTGRVFDASGVLQEPGVPANALPRISIVTPSFNQGEYLQECIESVLGQGYPNLEYIIMDGGSTDQSVEIIKKYEKYLTYWQSKPDGGQYPAINEGFRRSNGEVMAWINSDDRYYPGALQAVGQAFAAMPHVRWLSGRPNVIDAEGEIRDIQRLPSLTYADYLDPERDMFLQQESTFWRRDLWMAAGGGLDEGLSLAADFELWLRYFRSDKLYVMDRLLGAFRWHEGQKSGVSLPKYLSEVRATIEKEKSSKSTRLPKPVAQSSIELITSLVPRNDRLQRLAVKSWLKLGFQVTSINVAEEQRFLKAGYPEVKFVTPKRDGRKQVGKPCIYFDDILEYCKTSKAEVFGIINADIHLAADESLLELIAREAKGSLVYGSRYEVDSPVSARGWLYSSGFDYFFFDQALLGVYPKSDFMLGVPWWDYWAPLIPAIKGFPVKNLHAPIAFHVSHPINYSLDNLINYGLDFCRLIGPHRIAEMHEQHNRCLNEGRRGKPVPPSVTVLADMTRYYIAKSARRLEWHGTPCNLNANGLIDSHDGAYRVTAIVSTYNSEAYIGECLQDLVNQTIASQIDIVVIDAASPQNERAIVEEFQRRYPNIRYERTPERIGVYAAWNKVARMAKGHYLVSCSTNDRLRHDALELMARSLDEWPSVAVVYGNSYLTRTAHQSFDEFEGLSGVYDWPDFSFENLLREPSIGPHPMWRRSLHDQYGYFDETYKAISDQDFWLRVARHQQFMHSGDFTGLYLVDDQSLSGNKSLAQAEYREIRERHAREYQYRKIVESRIFHKALGRQYEERIPQWRSHFLFEIMVLHDSPDFNALIETIQSLAGQYYDNIRMTILSTTPQPEGFGGARMTWAHVAGIGWPQAINHMLEHVQGDWVGVIRAGDRIAPHAFLLIGEHLHVHPEWKLLYTDEDRLDPVEDRCTPLFKPDFDPDLLRNNWYMGGLMLADRDFLKSLGGLAMNELEASWYEVALRTSEVVGVGGVGHVPDVLYHRHASQNAELTPESASVVLQRHFQRRQLPTRIENGMVPGSWRVVYLRDQDPLVSVLIIFEGDVARLERALGGFLESTRYQSTELIVVDRGGPDAQTRAFLDGIRQLDEGRIKVLDGRHERTLADAVNHAAEIAGGTHLLMFDAGLAVVHQDWLDVLLSHGLRSEVGLVAPRLVYADGQLHGAWRVLGMLGPADTPYSGVRMEYAGYMGRLLTEQNVSAISAECFLLSKTLFSQLGGLSTEYTDSYAWALDLAMRCREIGKSIVWSPYATLLIGGNALALEENDEQWRTSGKIEPDADRLYQRWIPDLASDGYHNPSISRSERGMVLEMQPMLGWDVTPWKPVPRLLAHIADFEGCGNYRVLLPLNQLVQSGKVHGSLSTSYLSPAELASCEPDTVLFQRQIKPGGGDAIERYGRYANSMRIFEIDDLITEIPVKSVHRTLFSAEELACFRDAVRRSDRLIVSTEPLAQAYSKLAPETVVVPNYLAAHMWKDLSPARRRSPKPRVGWAGGVSHTGDLEMMAEVVMSLADEVDWIFFGMCPSALRPYIKEFHRGTSFPDYPARLASLDLDLAIAPLEMNAFNEAKSHLKLLEYGVLGYPVICTDIVPYQGAYPVTRVRNHRDTWIRAIREQVRDLDACAKQGDVLKEYVLREWMLEDHLDAWMRAWLS